MEEGGRTREDGEKRRGEGVRTLSVADPDDYAVEVCDPVEADGDVGGEEPGVVVCPGVGREARNDVEALAGLQQLLLTWG